MGVGVKRFLLFAGDDYYPRGGVMDFHASYTTRVKAKQAFENGGEYGGVLADWGIVAEWDGERFVDAEENCVWSNSGQPERRWGTA